MKALLQTFQCHAARRVRRVGQGRRALLLFPALLLMNGCAGWQEFETGSRLAERGDLDGAVNSLNQAVNADPRNARFVMALHETRIKAAQAHLLNARAMMEQNDATAAQAEIAKAFECYPELTESVELARDAEELTRQAETTSEASSQALEQAKWDKAVRLARQALAIDRGSLAALTASHKAIQAACVFHIQCADELLEAGNWLGCLAACQILEDLDAARSEYDVVRRQALNRREAEIRCREAAELASVTGFAAALELSESAVALWPENPRLVVFHDEIKESALCWFESEAEQATARSDYPGAITLLDEAASLYSSCGEVYARARQVSDRWADLLLDQCDTLQKESDWSALWQHAILAMTLSAARRDKALDYCGLAEKEILDDLRCRLIVRPISSSSSDLTLVAPVLERVTKALRKAAPAHFEIATEGAVSSNAQSPRDGQVIELRIFLEFDEQEDQQITRYDVSRYLAGRREARNPRFDELLRRKSQLENDKWGGRAAQYGGDALGKGLAQAANAAPLGGALVGLLFSMPGRVAKENANQQLAQVNNELASTSQTQWVEDWREHQYPVYLASRTIQCRTSFAMTELGEQKVFWEDHSLSATSQDRDEYVEPDSLHQVPGDSRNLKPGYTLRREAVEQIVPALDSYSPFILRARPMSYIDDNDPSDDLQDAVWHLFDCAWEPSDANLRPALEYIFGDPTFEVRKPEAMFAAFGRIRPQRDEITYQNLINGHHATPMTPPAPSTTHDERTATSSSSRRPPPVDPPDSLVVEGTISHEDDSLSEELVAPSGIRIVIKDTDGNPMDADLKVYFGSETVEVKDIGINQFADLAAPDGELYRLTITDIQHDQETVSLVLRRRAR